MPSSPLRRILSALSSLEIVNPSDQWNRTVPHAHMNRYLQHTACWGPTPRHRLARPLASTWLRTHCSHSIFGLPGFIDLWFVPGIRPWVSASGLMIGMDFIQWNLVGHRALGPEFQTPIPSTNNG